jgi:hypothetical protein
MKKKRKKISCKCTFEEYLLTGTTFDPYRRPVPTLEFIAFPARIGWKNPFRCYPNSSPPQFSANLVKNLYLQIGVGVGVGVYPYIEQVYSEI